MTPSEIAGEVFTSLATQTQSLIDELSGRDYAAAMASAHRLLMNMNSAGATLRHETAVGHQEFQEYKQEVKRRIDALLEGTDPMTPQTLESKPGEQPPALPSDTPPPEDSTVPPGETDPNAEQPPVFENESEFEGELPDDNGGSKRRHKK